MTRSRLSGLVVLLVCLLVAPQMLATSDHDKEKEKKDKESASSQQSHNHSSGNGQQHGSTPAPQPAVDSTNHHDHHSGETHSGETHASDTNRTRENYSKTHVDRSHHTDVEHVHVNATFDREHFHARMSEHPDSAARARAYERYHAERVHFVRRSETIRFVPANRIVLNRVRIVPTTYYYRRTIFYDEYGWATPRYVYSFYPRYGLWDAVFLAFALDHIADDEYALMFYHHRHEAEMQQWLADNRRLAEENEDLRIRLDEMDARVAELQESGVKADPSYVPADAQDVALSPEVIDRLTAEKK